MEWLLHHCKTTARHTKENQFQDNKCEHQQEQLREGGQRKVGDEWSLFKKCRRKKMKREGGRHSARAYGRSNTPAQG